MKHWLTLCLALFGSWLLWSGHFENPFLLTLGVLSALFCLWICMRMRIVDEEGAPAQLGILRPLVYSVWLIKEVVKSNIAVTRIILDPELKLQRNLIEIGPQSKTELGRVILANSITLTPGTISVSMDKYLTPDAETGEIVEKNRILVHALSFEGAEEDLTGDMESRVRSLEGKRR
jgi:multicomponent Na+:H+ antiporter subunit E